MILIPMHSIILLLFLSQLSTASESSFYPIPDSPRLGQKVFLFCELRTHDSKFDGIAPDLTTDIASNQQYNFNEIHSKLDSRYHGFVIPDLNSTFLQAFILIPSLEISDLSTNFTCSQSLFGDRRKISASLILANYILTTPLTSNPSDTHIQTEHPTQTMASTPNPTTSAAVMPDSRGHTSTMSISSRYPNTPATPSMSDKGTLPTPTCVNDIILHMTEIITDIFASLCSVCFILLGIIFIVMIVSIVWFCCKYWKKKKKISGEITQDIPPEESQPQPQSQSSSLSRLSGFSISSSSPSFKSCKSQYQPSTTSINSVYHSMEKEDSTDDEASHSLRRGNSGNSVETQIAGPEEYM